MCKAKERLQQAAGYIQGASGHWPEPGTIVDVLDATNETIRGAVQTVNIIGLRIQQDRGHLFIPWPAVRRVTWLTPEPTAHGADDVTDPPSRPRPEH